MFNNCIDALGGKFTMLGIYELNFLIEIQATRQTHGRSSPVHFLCADFILQMKTKQDEADAR